MIKKYSLAVLVCFCSFLFGYGQATLPLTRTSWNATPTGWIDAPLKSYTSSFACSTNNGAKFDTSGDYKIVNFNSAPDELTFVVKSNGASTSTLLVEESTNGTTYTTVTNLIGTANLPTTCTTKGPYSLNSATRFIR